MLSRSDGGVYCPQALRANSIAKMQTVGPYRNTRSFFPRPLNGRIIDGPPNPSINPLLHNLMIIRPFNNRPAIRNSLSSSQSTFLKCQNGHRWNPLSRRFAHDTKPGNNAPIALIVSLPPGQVLDAPQTLPSPSSPPPPPGTRAHPRHGHLLLRRPIRRSFRRILPPLPKNPPLRPLRRPGARPGSTPPSRRARFISLRPRPTRLFSRVHTWSASSSSPTPPRLLHRASPEGPPRMSGCPILEPTPAQRLRLWFPKIQSKATSPTATINISFHPIPT